MEVDAPEAATAADDESTHLRRLLTPPGRRRPALLLLAATTSSRRKFMVAVRMARERRRRERASSATPRRRDVRADLTGSVDRKWRKAWLAPEVSVAPRRATTKRTFSSAVSPSSLALAAAAARRHHAPMVASKKDSRWAQYQSLLVRRPVAMNITQGGTITAAGLAPATLLHRTPQHSTSLTTRRHSASTHAIHRTVCHLRPGLTLTLLRRHHHRGRQRRRATVP